DLFNAAGAKYGVSPSLLAAMAKTESNFNPRAGSPAGAQGLMQFMPGTARSYGIDPWDPAQAIDGGPRYMANNPRQFGRSVTNERDDRADDGSDPDRRHPGDKNAAAAVTTTAALGAVAAPVPATTTPAAPTAPGTGAPVVAATAAATPAAMTAPLDPNAVPP